LKVAAGSHHKREMIMETDTIGTLGQNETSPPPASVRRLTAMPARWVIAIILGYLALLPVTGQALAVEFDATPTQRPAVSTGTSRELADFHGVIIDEVRRITLPPAVRLRDLPTPGPGRRGGGHARDESATRRQRR
jgi:hypothetical protein